MKSSIAPADNRLHWLISKCVKFSFFASRDSIISVMRHLFIFKQLRFGNFWINFINANSLMSSSALMPDMSNDLKLSHILIESKLCKNKELLGTCQIHTDPKPRNK